MLELFNIPISRAQGKCRQGRVAGRAERVIFWGVRKLGDPSPQSSPRRGEEARGEDDSRGDEETMPKITFMGAGSTIFARNVLGDSMLVRTEDIEDGQFGQVPLLHSAREVLGVLYEIS